RLPRLPAKRHGLAEGQEGRRVDLGHIAVVRRAERQLEQAARRRLEEAAHHIGLAALDRRGDPLQPARVQSQPGVGAGHDPPAGVADGIISARWYIMTAAHQTYRVPRSDETLDDRG